MSAVKLLAVIVLLVVCVGFFGIIGGPIVALLIALVFSLFGSKTRT
jgi:uncharacterized membrane protein YjjP (DUF1212 family)